MRLFVGVELGDEVVVRLGRLLDTLRDRASRLAPHARVTWVSPERLHVTVRFIGNANDDRASAIRDVLNEPLHLAPFELAVVGTGTFPSRGRPNVIWAGTSDGTSSLQQVEREVSDRLERIGIAREGRDYTPHVTLARIRDASGLRSLRLLEGVSDGAFGTTGVDAATLFESRPSPNGPAYVPLQRIVLGAARQ